MKPLNILMFLTDDHGAWALPRHGNGLGKHLHAPTLAWMAEQGCSATNAYTPSPVCSPARASFWSGLMPSAHGLHDYLEEHQTVKHSHPGLQDRHLGQDLQSAGYHTMFSGKWHCGGAGQVRPGFDRWSSMTTGTNAKFGPQPFCVDGESVARHGYQAPFITDDAIRFLRERPQEKPFFCYVGYTDTHTPTGHAQPRLCHTHNDIDLIPPHDETFNPCHGEAEGASYKKPERQRRYLVDYLASVSCIDEQAGRILDELQSQDVLENTLVIYTSDHGQLCGQNGLNTKGNATRPQNMLEGSCRVPSVWMGPGIPANRVSETVFDHCDLHVTLLTLAGLDVNNLENHDLKPGRNIFEALTGTGPEAKDYIRFSEYGNLRVADDGRWKYLQRFPGPNGHFPDELYDRHNDPGETTNVLEDHPEVVARLQPELENFFTRYEREDQSGKEIGERIPSSKQSKWLNKPEN